MEVTPMKKYIMQMVNWTTRRREADTGEQILMRLTLGRRGEDEFYGYKLWHDVSAPLKKTKHRLALMALDDLMGTDYNNEEEGESEGDDEGRLSDAVQYCVHRVQYVQPLALNKNESYTTFKYKYTRHTPLFMY
jgi:hypothetical protein